MERRENVTGDRAQGTGSAHLWAQLWQEEIPLLVSDIFLSISLYKGVYDISPHR